MNHFNLNHFDNLKIICREKAVSQRIPITHLNSPTVFETHNAMLGMVIKLEGVTFDTENDDVLNGYKRLWHKALTSLDERFCVYVTLHRHRENVYLEGRFRNEFCQWLDSQYHAQFENKSMYVNDIYLTVLYRGLVSGKVGKGINFIQKLTDKTVKNARDVIRQIQLKSLKEAVSQMITTLSTFKPHLLGEQDQSLGYSELLNFLSLFPNGGQALQLKSPVYAPSIAKGVAENPKTCSKYPYGHIGQYLTANRLFFGKNIQFQDKYEKNDYFGAILSIKQYATESASIMLDPLLHLDCDFISTNTYACEAKDIALHLIGRHITKMENVSDPAVSQINALEEAKDQLASGLISMGYHHHTVMLLSQDQTHLEKSISKAIKCYADAGFVAVKETLGQEPAFWAQIPSNLKYITRSSLITSENFVDFAPLHNYRTGFRDGNHLRSAVTLLETPAKTPFFFNYHVKGSKDNPSKGHSIIIGGNGCGKTAFLSFIDAQLGRYHNDSFFFDRDRSSEIYIRACGGYYATLSPDFPKETCFNPLQLADTPSNRQFNREWLVQLCKNESELDLEADIVETLKKCIDYAYNHLALEHRTLTNATKILPIHFSRWPQLRRWLRTDGKYPEGDYAYLFDNTEDRLNLQSEEKKLGFDLTHFLDREPSHIRTALMMYLCHRVELAMKGQLVAIYFDEGWQNLIDPYWKSKFQRWLPTLRKKNAFIVLATQSPSSVIQSPLRSVMLDNVATQIFFANSQAQKADYIDGFKLTESEFAVIANNSPQSRLFLVKQEHDSTLCRLNLSHLPEALAVLSGSTATVRLLDSIRSEVGDNPKDWLPLFHQRRELLK